MTKPSSPSIGRLPSMLRRAQPSRTTIRPQAQLASTTASVSGAQAQVSEANVALAYCSTCRLRSVAGSSNAASISGTLVGPATNGFTLADTKSVKAVFGVPDTSIGRVRLGQHLAITTDSLPQQFAGRVSAISPAADPKSRVFSVEVTIRQS